MKLNDAAEFDMKFKLLEHTHTHTWSDSYCCRLKTRAYNQVATLATGVNGQRHNTTKFAITNDKTLEAKYVNVWHKVGVATVYGQRAEGRLNFNFCQMLFPVLLFLV